MLFASMVAHPAYRHVEYIVNSFYQECLCIRDVDFLKKCVLSSYLFSFKFLNCAFIFENFLMPCMTFKTIDRRLQFCKILVLTIEIKVQNLSIFYNASSDHIFYFSGTLKVSLHHNYTEIYNEIRPQDQFDIIYKSFRFFETLCHLPVSIENLVLQVLNLHIAVLNPRLSLNKYDSSINTLIKCEQNSPLDALSISENHFWMNWT